MSQPLWKHFRSFYMHLSYDPVIPILGVYPREMRAYVHITTYTQTAALFVTAKTRNNPNAHLQVNG